MIGDILQQVFSSVKQEEVIKGVKNLVQNPTQTDSAWFWGDVADSFAEHSPSYLTLISLVCAIGCFHNWVTNNGSSSSTTNATNTHSITRMYSSISQCLVAIVSFLTIVDKPHLQQLCSTALLLCFNFFMYAPEHIPGFEVVKEGIDNLQHKINDLMHKQKLSPNDDDEKESKDDTHHRQKQHQSQQQHHQQQQQQQQQDTLYSSQQHINNNNNKNHNNNHNKLNDFSQATRLILTWIKTAILSYIAALPTLLANNNQISRRKFSLFNPFSWFSFSREYNLFNPFSLSLINWAGIIMATSAIIWYTKPLWFTQSKIGQMVLKLIPKWYNTMANYTIFACGLFLTSFAFSRPLTYLSFLSPMLSAFFTIIRWGLELNKGSQVVPSLVKKLDKDSTLKQIMANSEKLLPCVAV